MQLVPPHLCAHELGQRQPRLLAAAQHLDLLLHRGAAEQHAPQQLLQVVQLGIG